MTLTQKTNIRGYCHLKTEYYSKLCFNRISILDENIVFDINFKTIGLDVGEVRRH